MNKKLFVKSVTTPFSAYDVTFSVNEKNQVLATVENSAGQVTHKDLGLLDLFGRPTRVPGVIHLALGSAPTPAHDELLERFGRICVSRLKWSCGCYGLD